MNDIKRRRVLILTINDKSYQVDLKLLGGFRKEIKRQLHEGVILLPPWCEAMVAEVDDVEVRDVQEELLFQ